LIPTSYLNWMAAAVFEFLFNLISMVDFRYVSDMRPQTQP
jgi:hypothetical protein